jgi:hypothetical protein
MWSRDQHAIKSHASKTCLSCVDRRFFARLRVGRFGAEEVELSPRPVFFASVSSTTALIFLAVIPKLCAESRLI